MIDFGPVFPIIRIVCFSIGYLNGGFDAWKDADCEINTIESVDADGLAELLIDESISLIDVRACGERKNGFLPVSSSVPDCICSPPYLFVSSG